MSQLPQGESLAPSGTKVTRRSSTKESAPYKLPPFPQTAVSPDPHSPNHHRQHHHSNPQHHHPNIETALNTTAAHVFPEHLQPGKAGQDGLEKDKDVSHEGIEKQFQPPVPSPHEEKSEDRDPDQQPLMKGTPLDELKTPMFERSSAFGRPSKQRTSGSDETIQGVDNSRRQPAHTSVPDPFSPSPPPEEVDATSQDSSMAAKEGLPRPSESGAGQPVRPGFGAGREMGSVRMGASALMSALNALPWEGDEDGNSSDEEDERPERQQTGQSAQAIPGRPKATRMHSSLHTIRPMSSPADEMVNVDPSSYFPANQGHGTAHHSLLFPFRQNTIARKAKSPGVNELSYQFANQQLRESSSPPAPDIPTPVPEQEVLQTEQQHPPAKRADSPSSLCEDTREVLADRIEQEAAIGEEEEREEIVKAVSNEAGTDNAPIGLEEPIGAPLEKLKSQSEENVVAALREGSETEEVEDQMVSNATERKQVRREKLAERLQEVFGLEQRETVLEEMRCWLLKSVMLKGYMYLTPRHICFFAHMPAKGNLVVKTGPLAKKNSRTKLSTKFWAVLRNDVLSWYESTNDLYFPKGSVSLQYASSCDVLDDHRFKLRTAERNYTFTADTTTARDEWIKAIQKVMFKTQHEGDSIKLIIPLQAILEVEKSPTLEFAETLEIKCVDPDDQMSVDSYFFASFQDGDRAREVIQKLLDARPSSELPRPPSPAPPSEVLAREPEKHKITTSPVALKKISSVLKPLVSRSTDKDGDSNVHNDHRSALSIPSIFKHKPSHDSLATIHQESESGPEDDGYPPRQAGIPPPGMEDHHQQGWSGWIKKPTKIFSTSPSQDSNLTRTTSGASGESSLLKKTASHGGSQATSPTTRTGRPKGESVTEVVEPLVVGSDESDDEADSDSDDGNNQSSYSLMERSESNKRDDDETARKFRNVFSLTEKEELLDHFPGSLYRVLPVSGRFFVSTNFFCFRSSQLLYKTKMMIPIRDIYGLKAQKAFRFNHYGLIVIIKGHEEVFLEFSSSDRRKGCVALLEARMEELRLQDAKSEEDPQAVESRVMEDLDENVPMDTHKDAGLPSMMFGSSTSTTFLEFKPEPMRITCLTIGSRGDVQPYIALCKGLQAEGHLTKIATHGEYKEWVEGHGIEFASVGGDPAELMQMCVDNGMFTVSFLKEGLQKFRGWLDDLLNSSWEACQNSDLLIESPSAMGGIHIAEALRIPYYRAFTMPWTRTRAYPHAFAVPDHKRGGSYNYMTYTMFDQVFWRAIAGQVNRWRRKVMHIDATNFDKLEQHKVPFLYNFSPNVVPPPLDWTEWIHVTGYWFLENADESAEKEKKWSPPEGLIEFIDQAHEKGKRVVYIGFGSIVVSDPQEMTRCVVDAVVESGVCAILSKGWSDRGSKSKGDDGDSSEGADGIKYPPEIFAIDSIDHSWLFPKIDAACHHGGAGTSGASLRAGLPTIIKPFFGDQAFWSERVESLNVGSAIRKLTSEALAEALKQATTDEKQIAKAKVVGEMIRKENGVARAIEAIYRDLEYAKSLIKPPPEHNLEKTDSKSTSSLLPLGHIDLPFRSKSRERSPSPSPGTKSTSRDRSEMSEEMVSDSSWDHLSEDHEHDYDARTPGPAHREGESHEDDGDSLKRKSSGASGLLSKIKSVVP